MPATTRVLILLTAEVNLLDLSGPAQVFSAAAALGYPYDLRFVGDQPAVRSAQGMSLADLQSLPPVAADDVVIVPGADLTRLAPDSYATQPVLEWLRTAHSAGAILASVCTGAAILGDAGLLDGRRCTTHWRIVNAMQERYPRAKVVQDVLYVTDDRIRTSAGIASGIDLALDIVANDHGAQAAAAVAREIVVYVRRNGDAAQLSPFLAHRDHVDPFVHATQDRIVARFAENLTLDALAEEVHVSARWLTKTFRKRTGITPLRFQQEIRVGHATQLLTATSSSVDEIASVCGYRDARHFRRVFHELQGVTPSAYRQEHAA